MSFSARTFLIAALLGFGAQIAAVPFSSTAFAQEAEAPSEETASAFVEQLVDKLRTLAMADTGDDERLESLSAVLTEDMAVRRLQNFLLSREQRSALSEEEVAKYDALFAKYIASAYAGSIDQLVSRQIDIRQVVERRPGDFIVRSKLLTDKGEERAALDWRLLERGGKLQLVDVMIDGLSFNVERRAQFTAILNKDGFGALLAHMEEVAGETV